MSALISFINVVKCHEYCWIYTKGIKRIFVQSGGGEQKCFFFKPKVSTEVPILSLFILPPLSPLPRYPSNISILCIILLLHSLIRPLIFSLAHSLTRSLNHHSSPDHSLAHSPTYLLTLESTHVLTLYLKQTHSLTHTY